MTGATCNIYAGLHEPFDMMVPLHFLRPGDLFLDIGANIGYFSLLLTHHFPRLTTVSFEPNPLLVETLSKSVRDAALQQRVNIIPKALAPC